MLESNEKPDLIREQFTELYDFAPSGFLLLSKEGKILKLNTNATKILGKERVKLINCNLVSFISSETKDAFETFFKNLYSGNVNETCKVQISVNDTSSQYVQIYGTLSANMENCLLNLVDISELKQKEKELNILKVESERCETEYKAVTDYLPIAIYKTDEKGDCVFCK